MHTPMRHVIVGNGVAGITAAETIRDRDDEAEILVVSDEYPYFYARTALMWVYMRQLRLRELEPRERWHWDARRIELRQDRVTRVDAQGHRVHLRDGGELPYDRLLLAVGGRPNMCGWPGQDLDGVCHMTTLGHLRTLEALRPRLERAVVVGGGLIGVELVEMMLHDRVPVTFVVREPWFWDSALCEEEARLVEAQLREHGAELLLGDEVAAVAGSEGRVTAVRTRNGRDLPCQLCGVAVGVSCSTSLARASGLRVDRGVVVDGSLCTSHPDVLAAGDCAQVHLPGASEPLIQKLWYTGIRQGEVAGRVMTGANAVYDPGIPYNSAQFLFLDYLTVGWMARARPGLSEWFRCGEGGARQSVRIAHDDGRRVTGFSMLGSRWNAGLLMRWIEQRRTLRWVLSHLGDARFDEEFRSSSIREMRRAG